MKIKIKIEGKESLYDLDRVHYISSLDVGNLIIVNHPETHQLCRAKVVMRYDRRIEVVEDTRHDAPYRWGITKSDLFDQVFLVRKQYKSGG